MIEKNKKSGRGGARAGAGRPRKQEESKSYTFRASGEIAKYLDAQEQKTEFIKNCIAQKIMDSEPDFSQIGEAYPATMVKDLKIPFFDIGIAAGFPIPLDNDERAQSIELLQMLCPYPESSYLIRVDGDSMIEAGIYDGDICLVDRLEEISDGCIVVAFVNGGLTVKTLDTSTREKGYLRLMPHNPDFRPIIIDANDQFILQGKVTSIHRDTRKY